jgi:DNA-binding PadR family transcriptional regulator
MSNPNYVKQGEITTHKILAWLYEYKYSTSAILEKVAELSTPGIYYTLSKMKKKGLLVSSKPSPPMKIVWGITWEGICELGEIEEARKYEPSKFNELTATHHYNLQSLALLFNQKGYKLIPLKKTNVGSSEKIPDGYIINNDQKIAIELERTIKTKSRYKNIWGGYINDIRKGHYSSVKYYLPNKRSQTLPKIFNSIKTIVINGQQAEFTQDLRDFFSFTDISDKI